MFVPGDQSVAERLNELYNDAKHGDNRVQPGATAAEAAFTIWMTNDGLRSNKWHLTWTEAAETLDGLASIVEVLQGAVPSATE